MFTRCDVIKNLARHYLLRHCKGGCTGSSESTLAKMPYCWKSHAVAQFYDLQTHLKKGSEKKIHLPIVVQVSK